MTMHGDLDWISGKPNFQHSEFRFGGDSFVCIPDVSSNQAAHLFDMCMYERLALDYRFERARLWGAQRGEGVAK
jgi:hypothetical protein